MDDDDLNDLDKLDKLDYQRLVQDALLEVPRRILAQVAERGLPGEHFFYVGFRTAAPGVRIPPSLRSQFPEEMTIILQHQFWDLEVDEEAFSVSLNFNASRQRVTVPFRALTTFVDPSTEFGLRFDAEPGPAAAEPAAADPARDSARDSARGPKPVAMKAVKAVKAVKEDRGGEVVPFGPRQRK